MGSFIPEKGLTGAVSGWSDIEAGMEWILNGQFCPQKTATFSAGCRCQRVLASSPGKGSLADAEAL